MKAESLDLVFTFFTHPMIMWRFFWNPHFQFYILACYSVIILTNIYIFKPLFDTFFELIHTLINLFNIEVYKLCICTPLTGMPVVNSIHSRVSNFTIILFYVLCGTRHCFIHDVLFLIIGRQNPYRWGCGFLSLCIFRETQFLRGCGECPW